MIHQKGTFAVQKLVEQFMQINLPLKPIIKTIQKNVESVTSYPCIAFVLKRISEVVDLDQLSGLHRFLLQCEGLYFKLMQGKHTVPILKTMLERFHGAEYNAECDEIISQICAGYSKCATRAYYYFLIQQAVKVSICKLKLTPR